MVAQLSKEYMILSPKKALVRLISYIFFEGRPLTTRGRWINPLVLMLGRFVANLGYRPVVESPIYILGQGRSGTTILGLILSLHKAVGFLNEPKALWHTAYENEDLAGNFTDRKAAYILTDEDATDEVQARLCRLYSAYLLCTASRRVLDKYPELLFRVGFVQRVFPDARFLLVVRNGWDVCRSVEAWSELHRTQNGGDHDDWWGHNDRKWNYLIDQLVVNENDLAPLKEDLRQFDRGRDRAALEWLLTMRMVERVQDQIPRDTLLVKYESLANDSHNQLQRIFTFCNLGYEERVTRYAYSVLRTVSASREIDLDPLIEKPFLAMMKSFDYL